MALPQAPQNGSVHTNSKQWISSRVDTAKKKLAIAHKMKDVLKEEITNLKKVLENKLLAILIFK